ncbi:MAG: carbohydrate kinase family protein [Muribaculaceae bacterium]|nr:carbohydrate kinase family protein [Muribaculaceae bacterium]MBR0024297.1 carbohydrate kinase family protein [Muribaculaceae bacterium]
MRITVIGAANVDITASPIGRYVPCDSNPSRVEIAFGGVGRNIAHNLCLMGEQVRLFTVFGDDSIALSLRDDCRRVGMTVDPILEVAGARSNYFICVNDHNGEMQAGAADMELMSHLTTEMVETYIDSINASDAVVTDCNLSEDVLRYLAERCAVPLYVDATSAAKAMKIKAMLDVSRSMPIIVKVNQLEAVALSGIKGDVEAMARWFVEKGVTRIYITMGARGVYCHDGSQSHVEPSQAVTVVNATGAGDAFMAAVVHAELSGATMQEVCSMGVKAAALALQSKNAVNDNIKKLYL